MRRRAPDDAIAEEAQARYDDERAGPDYSGEWSMDDVMNDPISRSETLLRTAIIDVLCSKPSDEVGGRLRRALNESREPGEHPEDRCEECRRPHASWCAPPDDWWKVSGRSWGGPILCEPCFRARLEKGYPDREAARDKRAIIENGSESAGKDDAEGDRENKDRRR